MSRPHPGATSLKGFLRGALPVSENRGIVLHLLAGCPECSAIATSSPQLASIPATPGQRAATLSALKRAQAAIAHEEGAAPALLQELMRHPHSRRTVLVRNSKRFQTLGLCKHILDSAFDLGFREPVLARYMAELAVSLAEALQADRYPSGALNDLRARAWGTLGNARRICSDLPGANQALKRAFDSLDPQSPDPLEHARLLSFLSTLRSYQRLFAEAHIALDRAIRIHRRFGDQHTLGSLMVDKATILAKQGETAASAELTHQALKLLDFDREPRRVLIAKHNLVLTLQELGRLDDAYELLSAIRPLYALLDEPMTALRLRWLEARLLAERGDSKGAVAIFEALCEQFTDSMLPYEAALVALETAQIHLRQGRLGAIEDLVSQMLATFRTLGVAREAIAAVSLLQSALQAQTLTAASLRQAAACLETLSHKGRRRQPSPQS